MNLIVLDQPMFQHEEIYDPFALTDVLLDHVSETKENVLHFWQYEMTFILGMKDMRVPFLHEGIHTILQESYHPVVRNSGGLGVIADRGILNVTRFFPKSEQMTTDGAYEVMVELTRKAFPELTIDAYEIAQSYCPGTYDLSVSGKKIAGLAQRRVKEGIAVMMYLSVSGNQDFRGTLVKNFYQTSLKEKFGTDGYPAIDPSCMSTVSSLLQQELSIEQVKDRFIQSSNLPGDTLDSTVWLKTHELFPKLLEKRQRMAQRNLPIKEMSHEYTV